jgi:hypothetical protein
MGPVRAAMPARRAGVLSKHLPRAFSCGEPRSKQFETARPSVSRAPPRPARTWFQTEREKKAIRDATKAAADGRTAPGAAAAKEGAKDAKSKKREKMKEKRAAEAEARRQGRANKLIEETEEVGRAGRVGSWARGQPKVLGSHPCGSAL